MIPVAGGPDTQEFALKRAQVTGAGRSQKGKVWKGASSVEGTEWSRAGVGGKGQLGLGVMWRARGVVRKISV